MLWTYAVKEVDGHKKARCVCDDSTRAGQVVVLDHTNANGLDQTGSRIFYAAAIGRLEDYKNNRLITYYEK